MPKFVNVIVLTISFLANQASADVPCDLKGISVGDTMTVPEIMTKLGIKQYKMNPQMPSFVNQLPLMNKYGINGAAEIVNWKIGPYCTESLCWIPYGVNVGIDIPASIFVSYSKDKHQIQAIDVMVNSLRWDELVPILKRKYGSNWKLETAPINIMNYQSKRTNTFESQVLTHRTGGRNSKTGDTCELSAQNYDIIFEHGDPLGLYHASFEIKLISTNF